MPFPEASVQTSAAETFHDKALTWATRNNLPSYLYKISDQENTENNLIGEANEIFIKLKKLTNDLYNLYLDESYRLHCLKEYLSEDSDKIAIENRHKRIFKQLQHDYETLILQLYAIPAVTGLRPRPSAVTTNTTTNQWSNININQVLKTSFLSVLGYQTSILQLHAIPTDADLRPFSITTNQLRNIAANQKPKTSFLSVVEIEQQANLLYKKNCLSLEKIQMQQEQKEIQQAQKEMNEEYEDLSTKLLLVVGFLLLINIFLSSFPFLAIGLILTVPPLIVACSVCFAYMSVVYIKNKYFEAKIIAIQDKLTTVNNEVSNLPASHLPESSDENYPSKLIQHSLFKATGNLMACRGTFPDLAMDNKIRCYS